MFPVQHQNCWLHVFDLQISDSSLPCCNSDTVRDTTPVCPESVLNDSGKNYEYSCEWYNWFLNQSVLSIKLISLQLWNITIGHFPSLDTTLKYLSISM